MTEQPLIDISPENWQIVRDILQRHVPDREVWVFGSRAKWTAKEFSDLDIAIVSDEPLSIDVMAELNESFQDSALPFKVDVVDWATITPSFRQVIEKDKVGLNSSIAQSLSDWQATTLGEIALFKAGSAFKPAFQGKKSGQYPFIKVSDMNLGGNERVITTANNWIDEQDRKAMKAALHPLGATVFAKIGVALTSNRRRLLSRETAIDNNMMSAIPNHEKVLPEFLYYVLTQIDFNLISNGTALPYLNVSDLQKIQVRLPSLNEQEQICLTIGSLDKKITLLQETNITLEAIAKALFKSWFVDFDPVCAKAEGREPEGVPPEVAELFPSEFEDSELGQIPKGWSVCKSEALLTRLSTKVRYSKEQVSRSGATPVYEQGADILLGYHDGVAQFMATPDEPLFIFGDHTCVTHLSCEPFDISMNVIPLKGSIRPTLWTFYAIKDKQSFQEYRRHWMELVIKNIVVAPHPICSEFANIASALHRNIEANIRQSNTLATLRDALLPRLMTGRVSVGGIAD